MTYAKTLAQIAATILSAIIVALTGDSVIDDVEWVNIAITGVSAISVFYVPNAANAAVAKAVVAAMGAVLTLLVNLIADGVTLSEWLQLAIAALGALGVYSMPNRPTTTPVTAA